MVDFYHYAVFPLQSDLSLDTIGSYKVLYDFICRIQIELPRDLTLYISFCNDLECESCQVFSFYYIIVWGVKVIVIVFPRIALKKVIAPVQALPLNPVRQLYNIKIYSRRWTSPNVNVIKNCALHTYPISQNLRSFNSN